MNMIPFFYYFAISTPNKLLQTAEELNDDSLGIGIGTALLRTFVRSLPWTDYVQRKS